MEESTLSDLLDLLGESCDHLERTSGLLRFVGLSAADAASQLFDDARALRVRLGDQCVQPGERRHLFDPELLVLDLATLRVSEWAENWRDAADNGRQLCWQTESCAKPAHAAVQSLLVSMANSLVGARMLVLKGLFVQARTLVRAYGEMADLTIAVLHSPEVRDAHLAPDEDFEKVYEIWRSRLAPGHLRAANERLWDEIGFTDEMKAHLAANAKYDQRWLSLAAHNYWLALAIGAMAHDTTQTLRSDGELELGVSLEAGAATLRKLAQQTAHFLNLFLFILHKRYAWIGEPADVKQKWSYFREQVMRDIWLRHLCNDEPDSLGADTAEHRTDVDI